MKERFVKRDVHASELTLVRKEDKMMLTIFLVTLALCAAGFAALLLYTELEIGVVLMLISVPFLIVGLVTYVHEGMWRALLVALSVPVVLFFAGLPLLVLFFVTFVMVGCVGVVSVAAVLQRHVFFFVISTVEYANIKEKPNVWDRLVVFAFNIPPDIDTRKITMEYNLRRSGIPVKEMMETMSFAFMVGIAMWIYLSMNPAFMTDINIIEAPIYAFSLIMFIPLIVLPWTPFKSLNVRITSNHRDFSLYGGAAETMRKMALPVFAVFVFILVAVNNTSMALVIGFIATSVLFNMLVVAASCVVFYLFFEREFVDDAVVKWKIFRPVSMSMELTDNESTEAKDLPGTPSRDLDDICEIEITSIR
ncbi:MAG: hypothetical protein FWD81_03535 [Methanomassiliicoccaceae archaeon]|nr:hypothetical protein [Methanomassiliicoccaceae archaeon]